MSHTSAGNYGTLFCEFMVWIDFHLSHCRTVFNIIWLSTAVYREYIEPYPIFLPCNLMVRICSIIPAYSSWKFQSSSFNQMTGVRTRQIWGIWKLRPAYSPETPNLSQNQWCFVPCDLKIWWMTLENNRASLLCCFKLCATFHSHWWIQTGVTVRKRPIWVKFDDF